MHINSLGNNLHEMSNTIFWKKKKKKNKKNILKCPLLKCLLSMLSIKYMYINEYRMLLVFMISVLFTK